MKNLVALMRINLIWYIPLSAVVVFYFVIPSATSGYHNVALVFSRFTWAIFVSPSAYLFFACILSSVFLPIQLLLMVPGIFAPDAPSYSRRYLWSLAVFVGIVVASFILQVLIGGSFPLPVDREGYVHLRMIPFFPWPETPLFG